MNKTITVTLEDGQRKTCPVETIVGDLLPSPDDPATGLPYIGALVNNELVTFAYTLDIDSSVRFVTMASDAGMQVYVRSLSFLLAKAVKDLFPAAHFSAEHALGPGLYCDFTDGPEPGISAERAAALEARMRELVAAGLPIQRQRISYTAAFEHFEKNGQDDKVSLLRFRNPHKVVTYYCDGFRDLAHGPMTRTTAPLRYFRIIPYQTGFVLQMPSCETAPEIPEFKPIPVLSETFKEYNRWGRILGINTVGRLNEIIAAREILIAGPSSSGKTTFAKRLAIQLRVNGLRPVTLGGDDYFVERSKTPRTPEGDYDFEHLEAMDLPVLNRDLADLDAGREIDLPTFDFVQGKRVYKGRKLKLEEDQVVIFEGIHSLNPDLTPGLPADRKFHIYISALTQLNLDTNNRIPTTDNRLIRRLVRDYRYRGHSAARTLEMWPNVGRGERRWIFPFQEHADAMFNSALDYELAILATYARPLLSQIKPDQAVYAEARRMLEFLEHFLPIEASVPPPTSIIREFIGGSDFEY